MLEMEPYTHCTVCTEDTPELRTPLNRPIFLPKILLLHILLNEDNSLKRDTFFCPIGVRISEAPL